MRYPYADDFSGHPGEDEWGMAFQLLDSDRIDEDDGRQLVNHELGHAFGLCDGGPDWPIEYAPRCANDTSYDDCVESIMHTYGCGANFEREWPTAADRASVEALVPLANPSNYIGGKSGFL